MYLLYFLLWIIYNGNITLEICVLGLIISAAIFAFTCRFADYSVRKELRIYKKALKFLQYIFTLLLEIIKANFGVIHMILTQKEEIEPVLVTFQSDVETPTGRAFLANAITLTPGTITVSLEENEYTVHCLDESMAEGLDDTIFAKQLKEMER